MSDIDSDPEFTAYLDNLEASRTENDDKYSDISVSSVHTSDLTDFDEDSSDSDSDNDPVVPVRNVNSRRGGSSSQWSEACVQSNFPDFTGISGPPRPQVNLQSPFDYFSLMIPVGTYQWVAYQTNLYAKQKLMASGVPDDKVSEKFVPTTADEIRAYIGLLMFMNISPLPSSTMYWAEGSPTYNPWLSQVMPRNRFQQLAQYFHLADSTEAVPRGQPGFDPLYKVRPLISLTQDSFLMNYHPGKSITVDEAMIKFKGRCSFTQYVPAKPVKWGLKVWAVCDADNFYMLNYSLYTGKINDLPAGTCEPLGDRVVKHLTRPFHHKWHTVFFDNYFTSVPLVTHLFSQKTVACGTVRINRKDLPLPMKSAKCVKKSGDTLRWFRSLSFRSDDGGENYTGCLQAIAWYDRRKVTLLTSAHDDSDGELVRKGARGVVRARYSRPVAVEEYSKGHNGVDKHDQLRSYYGSQLKFKKWWK